MKIISGKFRSLTIDGFNIEGTRPTMDRVKESLFAMIQNNIKDSTVLDLFAGSGNLGFESISNGAKFAYLNDKNRLCINVINKNINKFKIKDQVKVLNMDYKACLKYFKENNIKLDNIFLDPPYKMNCLNEVIEFIIENNLLNEDGLIICEVDNNYLKEEYETLEKIKERKYSYKYIIIYKKTSK